MRLTLQEHFGTIEQSFAKMARVSTSPKTNKKHVEGVKKMPIKVTFVATRKKRIKVERVPAYWQRYIPIEDGIVTK